MLISGVFAFAGRLWRANKWADAVALGIGYTGGHVVTAGWPAFPPAEATQWLPYLALAAMFLGVIDALLRPTGSLRMLIWMLCCMGFLRLLFNAKFQYGWSLAQGVLGSLASRRECLFLPFPSMQPSAGSLDLDSARLDDRGQRHGRRTRALGQHASGTARDDSCGCSWSNSCGGFPAPKGRRRTRCRSCRGGDACQSLAQRLVLLGASLGPVHCCWQPHLSRLSS